MKELAKRGLDRLDSSTTENHGAGQAPLPNEREQVVDGTPGIDLGCGGLGRAGTRRELLARRPERHGL